MGKFTFNTKLGGLLLVVLVLTLAGCGSGGGSGGYLGVPNVSTTATVAATSPADTATPTANLPAAQSAEGVPSTATSIFTPLPTIDPATIPTPIPTSMGGLPQWSFNKLQVVILSSSPLEVQATVSGYLPNACTRVKGVTQERTGNIINLTVIGERTSGAGTPCALVATPFTQTVKLDVAGLKAGTYEVAVNNVHWAEGSSFTLP